MQHIIKNIINHEEIQMLSEIIGASSLNLYIDEVGDFALNVIVESPDTKISIKNTPVSASDADEYPLLRLEQVETPVDNFKLMYVGSNIVDIFILRDKATWENSGFNWDVEADIGMKIVFPNEVFLLLAQDSLAGFIKLVRINKITPLEGVLEDYWSMKTDEVSSIIREEIKIQL